MQFNSIFDLFFQSTVVEMRGERQKQICLKFNFPSCLLLASNIAVCGATAATTKMVTYSERALRVLN
jgi:hypothetical protein